MNTDTNPWHRPEGHYVSEESRLALVKRIKDRAWLKRAASWLDGMYAPAAAAKAKLNRLSRQ